jgi:fibronectin type 3 domain-containing protein
MPWIDSIPPAAPELILQADKKLNILKWQVSNPKNEPLTYVVYRFHNHEPINIEKTEHIVSVQQETTFTDMSSTPNKAYTYVVTAMDRLWNESALSNTVVTGK